MADQEQAVQAFIKYCEEFMKNFLAQREESGEEENCASELMGLGYGIFVQDRDYTLHPATKIQDKYVEIRIDFYLYELDTELVVYAAQGTISVYKNKKENTHNLSTTITPEDKEFLKDLKIKPEE